MTMIVRRERFLAHVAVVLLNSSVIEFFPVISHEIRIHEYILAKLWTVYCALDFSILLRIKRCSLSWKKRYIDNVSSQEQCT